MRTVNYKKDSKKHNTISKASLSKKMRIYKRTWNFNVNLSKKLKKKKSMVFLKLAKVLSKSNPNLPLITKFRLPKTENLLIR